MIPEVLDSSVNVRNGFLISRDAMLEATEIVSTGSDEKQEDISTTKGLHFTIQHTIQNTGWTSNLKVLNGGQSSTIPEPIPSSTNTLPNVPNASILRGIDLRETPVILVQTPFKFNPDDASSKNLMLKIMPMAPVVTTVKPARTIPLTTTRIPNKVEQPVKRKPTLEVMDYRLLGKKRKTTTASNDVVTLSIPSIACQSTVSSISTPSLLKPNESLKMNNIVSSSETKSTSQLILCNKDTTEVPPPPKECAVPEGEVSLPPENIKTAARMKFDAILKNEIENHRMKSIKGGAVVPEKVSTSCTTGSGKTCAIALGSGVSNQVSQLVRIENAKIVKVHEVVKPVQPTTASNPTVIFPSNIGQTSKGSSSSLTSKSIIINTRDVNEATTPRGRGRGRGHNPRGRGRGRGHNPRGRGRGRGHNPRGRGRGRGHNPLGRGRGRGQDPSRDSYYYYLTNISFFQLCITFYLITLIKNIYN